MDNWMVEMPATSNHICPDDQNIQLDAPKKTCYQATVISEECNSRYTMKKVVSLGLLQKFAILNCISYIRDTHTDKNKF